MNPTSLTDLIFAFVVSPEYRPMKPRMILNHLKLPEEQYRELRRAIKTLVREGRVLFGANHLVLPSSHLGKTDGAKKSDKYSRRLRSNANPSDDIEATETDRSASFTPRASDVVGVFRRALSAGYGFVELPRGPVSIANPSDVQKDQPAPKTPDVFIPERRTLNAMDGDTVRVQLRKSPPPSRRAGGTALRNIPGRLEGEIVEIIERKKRQFTGTFQTDGQKSFVWLDGAKLERPVSIGDVRGLPVENNDKVIVELVRFPNEFHPGEAVLLKVLGSLRNPAVDTMAVMVQFNLPEEFPEAVLENARLQADRFNEQAIPEGRKNLTNIPTITIDPFDARDFDDAISLSKNEKGNWELLVHIADVSFFVPQGSILDDEARERGNSVYLPDRVIPMLPETISNHLASLQPDRNRLSKTVVMEYSPEGTLVHTEVFNSVIKNAYRFNYEQIDQYLADPSPWQERLTPEIFQLVRDMHSLAMLLRSLRRTNGSIELTLPEVKVDLDKLGKVKGAHVVHHTQSHQIIEEFMLAANQAVAYWLDSLKLPMLRRAHAPPDRLKIRRLADFMRALGLPADDMQDRFEIQRVIDSVRGQTTEFAVNYAILKSMSKAVYQCEFERHYALNMSHYCHFTSPIRRYPDLVVHRIVENLIEGKPAKENTEILERLGEHCSATEQNAESAERELVRVKLLHFLEKRIGELLTGIVWGVKPNGLIVRGIEIPVDGIVSLDRLPPDRYRYNRDTHTLQGYRDENQFRLGDELVVRIERVDLARRQLEFRLEKVTHHDRTPVISDSSNRTGADQVRRKGWKHKDNTNKSPRNKPSPGRKKRRR